MTVGVIIGEFAPKVQQAFDTARFDSVSARELRFIPGLSRKIRQ